MESRRVIAKDLQSRCKFTRDIPIQRSLKSLDMNRVSHWWKVRAISGVLAFLLSGQDLCAHEPHSAATYEITPSVELALSTRQIQLQILDDATGKPTPAQFRLEVDGEPFLPPALSKAGIRFTSIHTAKKQRATLLYSRGTEPVVFEVPDGGRKLSVLVTKGYEFLPETHKVEIQAGQTQIEIRLRRWIDLTAEGWYGADEHLHYERLSVDQDADWHTMLEADGLGQGFFMVLKGGNLPGTWAQQYAYGKHGIATREHGMLIPGEEFRGSAQGHNNLLGLGEIFEPITVGGNLPNWPSMHDALVFARQTGGIGGPAHGGTFGKASTVYLDALLGASEFVEVANTHLYELDPWYDLLSCGVHLPPVAGTDLPNFPYREPWQPFFGETRTYVRLDDPADFEDWKQALRNHEVFVSSGPMIRLSLDRTDLPEAGGEVLLNAEVSSPRSIQELEVVCNGKALELPVERSLEEGIHRLTIRQSMRVAQSSWFAARAKGERKTLLWARSGHLQHEFAHTAATIVSVGGKPVRVKEAVTKVSEALRVQADWYRENGKFSSDAERDKMLERFQLAEEKLQ